MLVMVNETHLQVTENATVLQVAQKIKPSADIFILNGYPVDGTTVLQKNDCLVLIKRGEIPSLSELEILMASRHTPGIHQRLKKAVVGIAGCGGLGSTVAVSLARVGIGTLIIADFDVVEPSNLNRQQYFIDQLGTPKVYALEKNLSRINPTVEIRSHPVKLVPENVPDIFRPVDVLVEALDRADQKAMLVETVEMALPGKPMVLGLGMAGYGFNNLLRTRSVGNIHMCGDEISEAGPHFGLMAPRVGIVANMQANKVLEILLGLDPRISASCGGKVETT